MRALNARLRAGDIRVRGIEETFARFDARIYARTKTYRYAIWNGATPSPFLRHVVWHVPHRLDLDWRRVYNYFPESHVRFEHAPHIRAQVECSTCHGNQAAQTVARRAVIGMARRQATPAGSGSSRAATSTTTRS